jgi:hypothetical protein
MTLQHTTTSTTVDRRRWSVDLIESSARAREDTPELQLLAIFDVLDDLFRRGDPNARLFVEALAAISERGALSAENADIQTEFRLLLDTLILEARFSDGDELALSWRLLLSGVISKSVRGDHDAALRAKQMGGDLVARHRPTEAPLVMVAASSLDVVDYVDFDAYDNFGVIRDTRP